MAFSDYGGYAYRNGERFVERSDYTLQPDGGGFGTPGIYPGFAAIAAGATVEEARRIADLPHYHVLLGDGPIFVGLLKQTSMRVHRKGAPVEFAELRACMVGEYPPDCIADWGFDTDWFAQAWRPLQLLIDDHKIEVHWRVEDNYYQYARIEQPDGTIWTGWAGYGVGAGLEDCGYGYSTAEREETMKEIWP